MDTKKMLGCADALERLGGGDFVAREEVKAAGRTLAQSIQAGFTSGPSYIEFVARLPDLVDKTPQGRWAVFTGWLRRKGTDHTGDGYPLGRFSDDCLLVANKIRAEVAGAAAEGPPALGASGTQDNSKKNPRQWKHPPDEPKPDRYRDGPIRGTNRNLSLAMGEKPTNNHRRLRTKAKSGRVWVIEPTPGARELEVWFDDLLESKRIAAELSKLTDKKLPVRKRKT